MTHDVTLLKKMADVHETCQSNGNNINEVSSKKKGNRSKQELDLDNTARGMSTTQSTSRFHVARVNDEKKTEDSEQPLSEEPKPTPASGKPAKQLDFQIPESPQSPKSPYDSVQFFAGTVSPNDTYGYNNSCETHMKTFGKNTVEAIPHVDHYRNLLSATAALKSRPTLAELHEEKVILTVINANWILRYIDLFSWSRLYKIRYLTKYTVYQRSIHVRYYVRRISAQYLFDPSYP